MKLMLTRWFLEVYLISRANIGLSALELKLHVGLRYLAVWLKHHKVMTAPVAQDAERRLSGVVPVDEAYLGCDSAAGKPGRDPESKLPLIAVISFCAVGSSLHEMLSLVAAFSIETILIWNKARLRPGYSAISDGLACFADILDAGRTHRAEVVGEHKPSFQPQFN